MLIYLLVVTLAFMASVVCHNSRYAIESAAVPGAFLRAPGNCGFRNNYDSLAVNAQWGHKEGEQFYLIRNRRHPNILYIQTAFAGPCYISAYCSDGGKIGQADNMGSYEKLRMIDNDDGTVSFQIEKDGSYLRLDARGGGQFKDNGFGRSTCHHSNGRWERFWLHNLDASRTPPPKTTTTTTTSLITTTTTSPKFDLELAKIRQIVTKQESRISHIELLLQSFFGSNDLEVKNVFTKKLLK